VSRTRARVTVRLKPAILDPQGRAVQATLHRLGHDQVDELRVGKIVEFTVAGAPNEAEPTVRRIAEEVLANPVMEDVEIALEPAAEAPAEG
jgi:phosphoribosylformylglycinamidine synthase